MKNTGFDDIGRVTTAEIFSPDNAWVQLKNHYNDAGLLLGFDKNIHGPNGAGVKSFKHQTSYDAIDP